MILYFGNLPSPNDPGWDSPWGRGRPGWHLECSVMSEKFLGKKFDIHGGGLDLVFPHHENEIAQSRCANQVQSNFANYWIHNGFVTFDKEKMSKSIGNIVTVKKFRENSQWTSCKVGTFKFSLQTTIRLE